MIKEGYEIRLVPARSKTGLYHPHSAHSFGIVVTRKPPGLSTGEVWASGTITYEVLHDARKMSGILYDLKKKVDKLVKGK